MLYVMDENSVTLNSDLVAMGIVYYIEKYLSLYTVNICIPQTEVSNGKIHNSC